MVRPPTASARDGTDVPRAGLGREVVVDLALAEVDDGGVDGYAALTLAGVARRAGVAVPSLYKHVDGLPALRRLVAERCVGDLGDELTAAAAGLTGADALRAAAAGVRRFALARPGRYAAVQGPEATTLGEPAERATRVIADAVVGLGVPPEEWVDAVRAVRAAVHGFVVLELGGGFGMPDDVDVSFARLVEMLIGALRTTAGEGSAVS